MKVQSTMRRKTIQIVGPCWVNKGDRLMVTALRQRLGADYYLPIPAWMNTTASRFWRPVNMSLMLGQAVYRQAQTFARGRPSVILDCSGYQYADPWVSMSRAMSFRMLYYQSFIARGGRLVMLPQSIGLCQERIVASNAAGTLQLADLVFVRDTLSRQHAVDLGCPPSRVRIAPDYTCLVPPKMPDDPDEWASRVCIVPNIRMIDKTPADVSSAYLAMLRKCIDWFRTHGLDPFILVFDREDRPLAADLQRSVSGGIQVVDPTPLEAKGILASCRAIVASRYHALASGLSQGTPTIGTGWTHKYGALFRDYSCEECLIEQLGSEVELEEHLHRIVDETSRRGLINKMHAGARVQIFRALGMFDELESLLDGECPPDE